MGRLIRDYDWSFTSLGAVEAWPQSLRSAISICLNSNFPIAIYWGKDLTLLYNDAWSPIPGNKHPWALGKPAKEVWPEIWDAIGPQFKKAFQGEPGGSKNALLPMQRHGYTEECYFDFTFTPIYGEGGKVEGVFNAVIETTKNILNERQLQTLTDLGKALIDSGTAQEVIEATIETLQNNPYDFPFTLFRRLEGSKAVLVHSSPLNEAAEIVPREVDLNTDSEIALVIQKAIATGRPQVMEDVRKKLGNLPKGAWDVSPDKVIVMPIMQAGMKEPFGIFVVGLNPLRIPDENYTSFFSLVADQMATSFSQVNMLEEERKRAAALAEIDKTKTAFFTNISHEFRTPLTLMLGSLEDLLKKESLAAEEQKSIETTHRNSLRLLRLVNNLLDFSRLEAGRAKAVYQRTDIAAFTGNLAANFRSAIEGAGLQFRVLCDGIIPPVYIDREMWEKIVLNLLSNAFKYTLNGSITVSLTTSENIVVLKVKDTGVGIPQKELPKMFQRFHRIENLTGRTIEGTGIGLSLVRELVLLHGGEITVQSREGEGTEFTVTIPTGKAHLPAEQVAQKSAGFSQAIAEAFQEEAAALLAQPGMGNGDSVKKAAATVLVVDDNTDMRSYMKGLLAQQFNVVTAAHGMEALQIINAQRIDLVVSDVMMPVMDGVQLLKAIKENPQTYALPVILVSARAGEEAKIEGFDIGADDYLVKPFSAKELLARVRSQIQMATLRHQEEAKLKAFFIQAPAAIAVLHGREQIFTVANPLYQKLFGRSEEQLIGKSMRQVWPEVEGQGIYELFDRVFTSGEPFVAHEYPATFLENSQPKTGYYEFVVQPIRNSDGAVADILVIAFDVTEQVNARRKTEESERRLSTILQQVNAGIASVNIEGRFIDVNSRFCAITGYSREELLQKNLMEITHPEDLQRNLPLLKQCIEEGRDFIIEKRYIRKDGTVTWVSNSVSLIESSGGEKFVTAVSVDISEQRRTQQILQESEERYATTVTASDLGLWDFDVLNQTLVAAGKMAEIYGLPSNEDYTLQNLFESIHPEEAESQQQLFADILSGKVDRSFETEYRIIKKTTGETSWVRAKGFAFFDESGTLYRTVGTVADITEKKSAAERIRESEERFRSTFENAAVGIAHVGLDGSWLFINNRICEIMGYSKDELLQLTFQDITHPNDLQTDMDYVQQLLVGTIVTYSIEKRYVRKDGSFLWANLTVSLLRDERGTPIHFVSIVQDISERKKTEEALAYQKTLLETVTENTGMALFLLDEKQACVYMNEAAEQVTGFTLEELKGKQLHNYIHYLHPDGSSYPLEECPISHALPTHTRVQGEEVFVHKNGSFYPVAFTASPILVEGKTIGTVIEVRNTTEEKAREQALVESQRQLHFAIEATELGIWDYNPLTNKLSGNERLKEWFGLPPAADVELEHAVAMIAEKDKKAVADAIQTALQHSSGGNYDIIYTIVHPQTGRERIVRAKGKTSFTENKVAYRFSGTLQDITVEATAHRRLEESESRFRQLANSLPLVVWTAAPDGGLTFISQQWEDYYGNRVLESLGSGWASYVHPDDVASAAAAWTHSLQTGTDYETEFRVKHHSGHYRWILVRAAPIRNSEGEIISWYGSNTDIEDKKRAETQIYESEERFRSLANAMPQVVWMARPNGEVSYYNDRVTAFKDVQKSPDGAWSWQGMVHPDDVEPTAQAWRRAVETGTDYQKEHRILMNDGTYRWHLSRALPHKNEAGQVIKWYGTATDIHEQKMADEAVRESENRFRTLAETLPQMIWMRKNTGEIEYASENWERYSGKKDISEAWKAMTHPDDWPVVMGVWENAMVTNTAFKHEVRLKNQSGEYRWHQAVGEPVRDEQGNVTKWIGALTDIHVQKTFSEKLEKKVAERTAELQKSQTFLQQLIDSSVEYISVLDRDLQFITVNKSFEDAMSVSREELEGKNLFDFNAKIKGTQQHQCIVKALQGETVHLEKRNAIENTELYVDTYYIPFSVQNHVEGVIIMARDVSHLVRAEKLLEQANRELQRSNEDLQQFAHVASHDLKEPVRKVMTFSSRLKDELGSSFSEKAATYLSKIEGAALRMYSMIDGVLLYSSLNALEQTRELIDLNELMDNIAADLEVPVQQKQAVVRANNLPSLEGSGILIYQLFYNLVNNSLKFARPGVPAVIELTAEAAAMDDVEKAGLDERKTYLKLVLQDNGIGFREEEAEKIFGTFTRLHPKDRYEGTGLGLSLCRKIVERHGGAIWASGKENEGASFTVVLPS